MRCAKEIGKVPVLVLQGVRGEKWSENAQNGWLAGTICRERSRELSWESIEQIFSDYISDFFHASVCVCQTQIQIIIKESMFNPRKYVTGMHSDPFPVGQV